MTTNAAEGPDPVKAAAIKETLASLHLAESEAAQAFSEGKPDASSMPKEDETIGTSCMGTQATFGFHCLQLSRHESPNLSRYC